MRKGITLNNEERYYILMEPTQQRQMKDKHTRTFPQFFTVNF